MALHLRACVPLRYFLPVNTRDSCLACTLNCSHTSFTVPFIEILSGHLQPHRSHQDVGRTISWLMLQTGGVGDGQHHLSNFFSLFLFGGLPLSYLPRGLKPLRNVELYHWPDSPVDNQHQGGLVCDFREGGDVCAHL